ncbi:MAG: hypothetical protein ACOH19_06820 [Rhodoglobus sp.]
MRAIWPSLIVAAVMILVIVIVPLMRAQMATRMLKKKHPSAIVFTVLPLPPVRAQFATLQRELSWAGRLPSGVARPVACLDDSALRLWNGNPNDPPFLEVPREQIASVDLGTIPAWRPIRTLQFEVMVSGERLRLDLPVFTATGIVSAVSVPRTEMLVVSIRNELWPDELPS